MVVDCYVLWSLALATARGLFSLLQPAFAPGRSRLTTSCCVRGQMDEAAIEDARRNASSNGITTATFKAADLDRDLPETLTELRPDVVIVGAIALRASYDPTTCPLHDMIPATDCSALTIAGCLL